MSPSAGLHIPTPFWPQNVARLVWPVAMLTSLAVGTAALGQPAQPATPVSTPATAEPTVQGGRITRPTLRLGSQGESVKELQSMLMLLGYYPGPVSGVYQEDTQQAVQRFQQAAAITADGIVGPATWSQLFPTPVAEANPPGQGGSSASTASPSQPSQVPASLPTQPTTQPANSPSSSSASSSASLPVLRPGMEGDAVRQLQRRLQAKKVYTGPVDGIFGIQTEAAVREIQRTNDLTVDGIVGPATWRVLQ
ncbi:MAG: peptidoglycan-binding protein [Leptolyngbyaceae cyanobacterium SM2_5_2]|nr:peptidoglycan-binding protein [Leptolyngbyaceae cyanobacterium SM2_5_2]